MKSKRALKASESNDASIVEENVVEKEVPDEGKKMKKNKKIKVKEENNEVINGKPDETEKEEIVTVSGEGKKRKKNKNLKAKEENNEVINGKPEETEKVESVTVSGEEKKRKKNKKLKAEEETNEVINGKPDETEKENVVTVSNGGTGKKRLRKKMKTGNENGTPDLDNGGEPKKNQFYDIGCLICSSKAHQLKKCPLGRRCFKCGTTKHRTAACQLEGDNFPFALCLVCKKTGHLARQCPDNKNGCYPFGGECRGCGSKDHLNEDCPTGKGYQRKKFLKEKKRCAHCLSKNHGEFRCPNGKKCLKCDSSEHKTASCQLEGDNFTFALCHRCKKTGHLSRDCPDGPKNHLNEDCPTVKGYQLKKKLKLKEKRCAQCLSKNHRDFRCPNGKKCLKCDSSEHKTASCQLEGNNFTFALCNRCKKTGHLSRDCPKSHLNKHCPTIVAPTITAPNIAGPTIAAPTIAGPTIAGPTEKVSRKRPLEPEAVSDPNNKPSNNQLKKMLRHLCCRCLSKNHKENKCQYGKKCLKCDSSEHKTAFCQLEGDNFTFALCIRCKKTGHLTKQCLDLNPPDNEKRCDSKDHLNEDCPTEKVSLKQPLTPEAVSGPKKPSDKRLRRMIQKNRKGCGFCLSKAHNTAKCPGGRKCLKCGSSEHETSGCHLEGDNYQFASCLLCKKVGHVAKQCPDNTNGLYPFGGECRLCGLNDHYIRDCPKNKFNKIQAEGENVNTSEKNTESDELKTAEEPKRKKAKTQK